MARTNLWMLTALILVAGPSLVADEPTKDQLDFFEKKIRPVLVNKCYECHSKDSKEVKGGLLLDTREGIRRGGENGHGVVPGEPAESLVLEAIRYESFEMPPDEQLSDAVIADFEKWIEMGAPDPREGQSLIQEKIDFEKAKSYWAYQPLHKPGVPRTHNADWPQGGIDRFVLARLESEGLQPADDADPVVLVRRVYFDLIGLQPTPEQIDEFVLAFAQNPRAALESLVDRLLASPQFGERWGRHWMDVVRYAESTGMERNFTYPQAWRYRDYVIRSFNEDKPYNRFVTEQLAGDQLPAKSAAEKQELLVATGFLALGPKSLNERNREQFVMDIVDEQIDVTTRAFLGLTVSCARCHDHKFDPFPQTEYYSLAGIFRSTETYFGTSSAQGNRQPGELLALDGLEVRTVKPSGGTDSRREQQQLQKQIRNAQQQAKRLVAAAKKGNPQAVTQQARIEQRLARLRKQLAASKAPRTAAQDDALDDATLIIGVLDSERPADTQVRLRGEPNDRGDTIPRGFLTVVSLASPPTIDPNKSGRLALAEWITEPANPLTSRVLANRVWQHLFGQGLVTDVNNFGENGERPTHPQLLDYLASDFVENGWSVKQLVRTIVLSRTYRLSTTAPPDALAADPDNKRLARQNQRRLEAEAIRDAMLLASGQLDLDPAEGSIVTEIGDGDIGRTIRQDRFAVNSRKRSVYLPIVRGAVPEVLQVFDFPEPSIISGVRDVTTVPTQALYMLNNSFVIDQAQAMAERILGENSLSDDNARLTRAFRLAFGREPSADERLQAREFLTTTTASATAGPMSPEVKAWTGLCHVLLASAEFRYLQ